MTENRRNDSSPKDYSLKDPNPESSNTQNLEANTTGVSKKNKLKIFTVANEAFKRTGSNKMFKTLLHYFYDSSQQHATKHIGAVINFLPPYINIIGILSSLLPLCLLSCRLKSPLLFLLSYQCNHFQLQQTLSM